MSDEATSTHPIDAVLSRPPGPARLLTDSQIREMVVRQGLIGGAYDPEAARYASYELHISRVVRRFRPISGTAGFKEDFADEEYVVIDPGETVWVYSAESINLPPWIHASVQALGQLFAAGLCAGNTYVDPGSNGAIYIAITNLQKVAARLPVGSPLARVQFHVLGDAVSTVHGGPETRRGIAVRYDERPEPADIRAEDQVEVWKLLERISSLEQELAGRREVLRRHAERRAKWVAGSVWIAALIALAAGIIALTPALRSSPNWLRPILVAAGIMGAGLALARVFFGGSVKEWLAALRARYTLRILRRLCERAGIDMPG